jgi:hypothetical protein
LTQLRREGRRLPLFVRVAFKKGKLKFSISSPIE